MPNANWPWKWKLFCLQLAGIPAYTSNRRIIHCLGAPTSKRANLLLHKNSNYSKNQECLSFQGLMPAEKALRSKPLAFYSWCSKRVCWCLLRPIAKCAFSSRFIQISEIINPLKMNWVHTLIACNAWSSFWAGLTPKLYYFSTSLARVQTPNLGPLWLKYSSSKCMHCKCLASLQPTTAISSSRPTNFRKLKTVACFSMKKTSPRFINSR